jgi:hypothetical protein
MLSSGLRLKNGDLILDFMRTLSPVDALQVTFQLGERPAPHRRGRKPGLVRWHALVDPLMVQNPQTTVHDVLTAFLRSPAADRVVKAVVRADRSHCREDCPAGYHVHLWSSPDPAPDVFRPLALQTIKNYLARGRRRRVPA